MRKLVPLLAVALLAFQQEGKDFVTNTELGFVIYKPVKSEEWEVKDKGRFTETKGSVSCIVAKSPISVEVMGQIVDPKLNKKPLDEIASEMINNMKKDEKFKDVEVKANRPEKFPGDRGQKSQFVEMTFVQKEGDLKNHQRIWLFYSPASQNFFQVVVLGEEEMYKKYQKEIRWVIGNLKTTKGKK